MTVFSCSHACVSAWRYPFVECGPVCHHLFSANLFLTENSIFCFWFTALRDTSVHLHNSRNSAEAARAATVKGTLRRGRLAGTERECFARLPGVVWVCPRFSACYADRILRRNGGRIHG